MISSNIKLLLLLMIFCVGIIGSGCKTLSRLVNKGGTVFTVEIESDAPNRDEIIELAVKITEAKLNAVGADGEVSKIPGKDNQISVKIYGSNNLEALKKLLFTSYQLELKKIISPMNPSPIQTFPTKESAEQMANKDQEVLPFEEYGSTQQFVIVEKKSIITGEDVRTADAVSRTNLEGGYSIAFSLKPEGAARFGDWTAKNIGGYLAIVLDKKVQSAPFIKSQIFDSGEITGRFTKQSAEDIALTLRSGYLPAKMKIIEEKSFEN